MRRIRRIKRLPSIPLPTLDEVRNTRVLSRCARCRSITACVGVAVKELPKSWERPKNDAKYVHLCDGCRR